MDPQGPLQTDSKLRNASNRMAAEPAKPGIAPSAERFARESGLAAEVAAIAEPVIEDLGFRLVRVAVAGGREDRILQIMAEKPDGTINIEDCEQISKALSPVLDVADPLPGTYRLEISSPGIDRPLVRPSDFEDWSGHVAKIELREPVDGRRRFKGTLEGFEDGEIRIACELGAQGLQHLGLPVALVAEAKLVLTDELIREALARAKMRHADRSSSQNPGDGAEMDENDLNDDVED